jgi:hypothetical protein
MNEFEIQADREISTPGGLLLFRQPFCASASEGKVQVRRSNGIAAPLEAGILY